MPQASRESVSSAGVGGGMRTRHPSPGPADYDIEALMVTGPKWGFPMAKRSLNETN
jgi:hypothetical protein